MGEATGVGDRQSRPPPRRRETVPAAGGRAAVAGLAVGNMPSQLTSFIGRRLEIAEVADRLETARLVTLTGVGGVGKSRLAVEVAFGLSGRYRHGIWLVELASLTQPSLVPRAVATVLEVPEHPEKPVSAVLARHLRDAELLLILDNCEHLVVAVADLVLPLLSVCPELRVLATSRHRLGITGEVLWTVPGLAIPSSDDIAANAALRFDAVRLFVDRATAVEPRLHLSDPMAAHIVQICRQLDGLPLAIELAAARVNALGLKRISERLNDQIRLRGDYRSAAPRHTTLRAAIEWSYQLLVESERRLFARLAVFAGGFPLEAAEEVCGDGEETDPVVGLVCALVDKSLITVDAAQDSSVRYRLLETLRAYGLERLAEHREADRVRDAHAAYYTTLAEQAWQQFRGPQQAVWLDRLETEHANLRAALEWTLAAGASDLSLRLAGSLSPFWDLHGHYAEGRRWLERALAAAGPGPPAARVRALNGLGTLAVIQADLAAATRACEQAVQLSRANRDTAGLAYALHFLGFIAVFTEEFQRATALLEESLVAARESNERWLEGWSYIFLTIIQLARGDYHNAIEPADNASRLLHLAGEPEGIAWAMLIHGVVALELGDIQSAAALCGDGLRRFWHLTGHWGLSMALLLAGRIARSRQRWNRTARLMAASEATRDAVGAGILPFVHAWLEQAANDARHGLGDAQFDNAWREGSALPLDHAAREAAAELGTSLPAPTARQRRPARKATDTLAAPDLRRPGEDVSLFRREGEYWTITYAGATVRLKDAVGLRYLAALLHRPGQELHCLDLVVMIRGDFALPQSGADTAAVGHAGLGDAGLVLDQRAKSEYRQRLRALAADLEEAQQRADLERASLARLEIDAITDQLAAAVGLGGRDRTAASAAERARVNITKAIRGAITRIERQLPPLGQHLGPSVRTGTYCTYAPDPALGVTWSVDD
jgi:predicted ATPase